MAILIVLASVLAALLLLFFLYLLFFVRPRAKQPTDTRLLCDYAHRGLHGGGVPENSLAAFEKACAAGFGIELDVQLSRDGEVMVFHDYTLVRMTGVEKKLCELTAEELGALHLAETDEKIPTLREVLSLVDGRVPLLVELKGENGNTALCPKVAELLREYRGPYCIESFNPLLLRAMRREMPDVFYGLLYTNLWREKKGNKKRSALDVLLSAMVFNFLAKPNFIAYKESYREELCVRLATKFYRAPRFVWTVRSKENMELAHRRSEHPIFEKIE
ncbi:MAG: glycerophosphodiester phosphodiesterase [Clostridia bacterium]|nr:glycerophosphodiester phosphodiesterase [Clostridia bacterium]